MPMTKTERLKRAERLEKARMRLEERQARYCGQIVMVYKVYYARKWQNVLMAKIGLPNGRVLYAAYDEVHPF